MRKYLAPLAIGALMLSGCSQPALRDSDPAGYEACTMLDRARDQSVDVDERLELAIFTVGEQAAKAKTQKILDGIEKFDNPAGMASMPKYSVKDSLTQACRDLGVSVRDVPAVR